VSFSLQSRPRRLLLIDPESGFRRILREQVEQTGGWHVEEAHDLAAIGAPTAPGDDLRDGFQDGVRAGINDGASAPDFVVASVSGRAARALLVRWRRSAPTTPLVALLRAGAREVAGASATVPKPIRLLALLGVIADLAGRGHPPPAPLAANGGGEARQIGPYKFDPATKRLIEQPGTRTIRLTEKETAMLDLLWHAAGTVVPRDALLAQVWGYQAGISTHTLETHVYRLRRKIERDPARAELLITELGGYRLVR
jgi:DNA-binding response OmpR family regulator